MDWSNCEKVEMHGVYLFCNNTEFSQQMTMKNDQCNGIPTG